MRVVLQRSGPAAVRVGGETTGSIEKGYVLLVGLTHSDTEEDAYYLAKKIAGLRLWEDAEGKMNHSILETGGDILSVSQFTLFGDVKKGAGQVSSERRGLNRQNRCGNTSTVD